MLRPGSFALLLAALCAWPLGYYLFGGKGANVGSNNNRLALGRNVVTAAAYTQDGAPGSAVPQRGLRSRWLMCPGG